VREGCGFNAYLLTFSVNVILEYGDVERASCPSNRRIKYFYILFYNMLIYKWLHAAVIERLHIFINDI
jgi:hypothetical protein